MARILILTIVLAGAPAFAAAQTAREDDPRVTARAHVGPVYFTPSIAVRELGVDTNVFNQAAEAKSDFTYTLTPHLDVWLPFARRAMLQTSVGADAVYDQTYDNERSFDPQTRGRALFVRARAAVLRRDRVWTGHPASSRGAV